MTYDDNNIVHALSENTGLSITMISSERCRPCQEMKPVFDEISDLYSDVTFFKTGKEEAPEFCNKHDICFFPTLLIHYNRVLLREHVVCSKDYENETKQPLDTVRDYITQHDALPAFESNRPEPPQQKSEPSP